MWKTHNVARTAVLGLLLAACTDRQTPTETGVALRAGTGSNNAEASGERALVAQYTAEVPLAYYQLSLTFSKRTAGFTPPVQSRAYAYMGLALYEALVSGMPEHRSVASQLHGVGALPAPNGAPYHWPLVANAALAEVMRGLWGDATQQAAGNVADLDALEARFVAQYADVPPGLARQSIEYGHAVGAAVFAASMDDGAHRGYLTNFPSTYAPPVGLGLWVPTAPGQVAMQPYWGTTVRTFALATPAECDPGAPRPYSEQSGDPFYQEAREIHDLVAHPTPEHIEIARYWADGGGTISGPGHLLAIASQILVQEHASLAVAAEAYGRAGLADADAITSVWWVKYHYNLLRPVTYIRAVIDPAWTPLLPTPPFPEYVSAHSAQSAAVASTLEDLFGQSVAFVDHAHDADGFAPRSFPRIFAAAEEAGRSRMYAGIHFRSGNLNGLALGRCAAAKVRGLRWRR
jgi:hypothetical protein